MRAVPVVVCSWEMNSPCDTMTGPLGAAELEFDSVVPWPESAGVVTAATLGIVSFTSVFTNSSHGLNTTSAIPTTMTAATVAPVIIRRFVVISSLSGYEYNANALSRV